MRIFKTVAAVAAIAAASPLQAEDSLPPPLPIEPIGVIETLPERYPDDWLLVHEAAFFNMSDGKVIVLDSAAETLPEQYKGMFNVSFMGNFLQNSARSEIYAVETFHTRGTRGDRIDVLTVWDMQTLSPRGEVLLPQGKRFMGMPLRYAMQLINNGRWLALANLSPATSVSIVDVETLALVTEVATPGCTFTYPAGDNGFSSLCADGRFMSTQLNADGSIRQQVRTDAFFSSDDSPIYERPALIGTTAYFPTVAGLMFPVDIGGDVARVGEAWSIVPDELKAEKWAPGGIELISRDDQGLIYILMHPDAADGSYQGGGSEVWVIDPLKRETVRRLSLKEWGLSLAVTHGSDPRLVVLNPTNMSLEVYHPVSGELIRVLNDFGQTTPLRFAGSE